MSFQDLDNGKHIFKKIVPNELKQETKNSLLINSSFNIDEEGKTKNKEITSEVLKKVSETIVSLHSTLVPKTQNIEIYRDLSQEQQKMLKLVQDNKLIHTILAGVLAIDSCLKYIHRQQTYIISSLMKGVTITLGNYKKVQEQFLAANSGKISQNFLKFYDSLKLIISQIHKIPAAKIKKNQIDKHNELITQSKLNNQLTNTLNRQQNLLFAFLAQQNNSLRIKLKELQKQICQLQKQKQKISKTCHTIQFNEKKKRDSETGSQSLKGFSQQTHIRQLKDQLAEKNDIIIKMNDQFASQIDKYQKVFRRLEQQNKLLKKYNDIDTAYILEQLQYEVERLRYEKRNDQNLISQIMEKMDRMSWNKMQADSKNIDKYRKQEKYSTQKKYSNLFNPKVSPINQRNYQMRRSRCPSVSPENHQMTNLSNRYFSPNFTPNFDTRELNKRAFYPSVIENDNHFQYPKKRNNSPRFGNVSEEVNLENIKQRISLSKQRKSRMAAQQGRNKFNDQVGQIKEMRKSQTGFNHIKQPGIGQQNFQLNKLRNRMKKSTFLNQEINY